MFHTKPSLCLLGLWVLCIAGLFGLASCAGADDSGDPQSFNAHLNGIYSSAAVATSVH
ncbi:MAG: hypothetical protein HIU92_01440 [Proteobacteria bacterium]|nr:hypothetical protein [Pseudomonadota bacterium]